MIVDDGISNFVGLVRVR